MTDDDALRAAEAVSRIGDMVLLGRALLAARERAEHEGVLVRDLTEQRDAAVAAARRAEAEAAMLLSETRGIAGDLLANRTVTDGRLRLLLRDDRAPLAAAAARVIAAVGELDHWKHHPSPQHVMLKGHCVEYDRSLVALYGAWDALRAERAKP